MNYNIFGSKFGLYGYLPAILKNKKNKVYLPKKYFQFLIKRNDLQKYNKKIIWYDKLSSIKDKINFCIIAKRPKDQFNLCKEVLEFKNLKHLYLEKPLAEKYTSAQKLLRYLKQNKINFSLAYIINQTLFYKKLINIINERKINKINVYWSFPNSNKKESWKLNHKEGGGIINFYGIHFIHLFSTLGFNKIISSIVKIKKGKEVSWDINIKKNSILFNFKLIINSKKKIFFADCIQNNKKINLIKYQNPFIKNVDKFKKGISLDYRSKFILKYLNNTKKDNFDDYNKTNILWKKIQEKTIRY